MMQKKSKLIGSAILTIVGVWGMIITLLSDGNIENITEKLINMLSKTKNNKDFIRIFEKSDIDKK